MMKLTMPVENKGLRGITLFFEPEGLHCVIPGGKKGIIEGVLDMNMNNQVELFLDWEEECITVYNILEYEVYVDGHCILEP